jgi:hypothetical protein
MDVKPISQSNDEKCLSQNLTTRPNKEMLEKEPYSQQSQIDKKRRLSDESDAEVDVTSIGTNMPNDDDSILEVWTVDSSEISDSNHITYDGSETYANLRELDKTMHLSLMSDQIRTRLARDWL